MWLLESSQEVLSISSGVGFPIPGARDVLLNL